MAVVSWTIEEEEEVRQREEAEERERERTKKNSKFTKGINVNSLAHVVSFQKF